MAKSRKFQIVITGTIPKGMTLSQVRHAYWNEAFGGDRGPNYNSKAVDVYDYTGRQHNMVVRLGRAKLVKA